MAGLPKLEVKIPFGVKVRDTWTEVGEITIPVRLHTHGIASFEFSQSTAVVVDQDAFVAGMTLERSDEG